MLLFLQAQGDLAGHAQRDLAAVEAAARAGQPGLVVSAELDDGSGPPRRLRLAPRAPPLPAPAVEGARVAARLRSFLAWGTAPQMDGPLAVALWGHGRGFSPGLLIDGAGDAVDPVALRDALAEVAARRGRPVDLLLLDACLMQSVEVLATLDGVARWVVGTPQIQGFGGLPYAALLGSLQDGPKALAAALPRLGLEAAVSAPPERQSDARFFALSAADPGVVARSLVPALDALGGAIDAALAADQDLGPRLRRKLRNAPAFKGGTRDVGALLAVLDALEAPPLRAPVDRARAALAEAVLAAETGAQFHDREYSGAGAGAARALSVWAPDYLAEYEAGRGLYAGAPLHRAGSGWTAWLERLHGTPARAGAR